jgi:hypothetical protein
MDDQPALTMVSHRLSREHLERLAAIAAMLSSRAGLPAVAVDRTDALRYCIDRVFLAECPVDGPMTDARIAA